MNSRFNRETLRWLAVHCLGAVDTWLVAVMVYTLPLIACAVMALHRIWLLLVFLVLRMLGECILHRLGWLRQGRRLRTVRSGVARSVDDFLEDVKAILERV